MAVGLIYTLLAGVVWVAVGAFFSVAAKRKIEFEVFMFFSSGLSALFAWIFVPNYGLLFDGGESRLLPLVFWMACVALLSSTGFLALRGAMVPGRHGLAWTMGQAAMLLPFAAGIVLWREQSNGFRAAGMLLLALSLPLCAAARNAGGDEVGRRAGGGGWVAKALLAFVLIGLSQVSSMVPSHWHGWTDSSRLRVPLIFLVSFLFWLLMAACRGKKLDSAAILPLAAGYTVSVLAGQWLLYRALDRMASLGLSAVVYPVAVGTCISGFYLYSLVLLRENADVRSTLGVLAAVGGIVLIAFGS